MSTGNRSLKQEEEEVEEGGGGRGGGGGKGVVRKVFVYKKT